MQKSSEMDSLVKDTKQKENMNRILSIQSHVVRGKVGNEAAVLPLELLGFRVDRLNTVQFSNHTGHGSWSGRALETNEVKELLDELRRKKWLNSYHSILTGYMRDEGIIQLISDIVEETGARWVCDPVMGDYPRGLYVPKELISCHRDISMRTAHIITPNQFEAEQISGVMINDERSAWECINKLHQMGPKQIVITSTNLSREGSMVGFFSDNINDIRGSLIVPELVDTRLITDENKKGFVEFTGTGDMFAACLCGHSVQKPFHEAIGCALEAVRVTLEKTLSTVSIEKDNIKKEDIELNQVAARREIMNSENADWTRFVKLIK